MSIVLCATPACVRSLHGLTKAANQHSDVGDSGDVGDTEHRVSHSANAEWRIGAAPAAGKSPSS